MWWLCKNVWAKYVVNVGIWGQNIQSAKSIFRQIKPSTDRYMFNKSMIYLLTSYNTKERIAQNIKFL